LERVEQTAGALGADGVVGETLKNLVDRGSEVCDVGQWRKINRLLLLVAAAARREDTRAGVEVAKGPAA
jgi:hypothetical protein